MPHVLGAAPAILGQGLIYGGAARRSRCRSRASTRCIEHQVTNLKRRSDAAAASTRCSPTRGRDRRHPARARISRRSSASRTGDDVSLYAGRDAVAGGAAAAHAAAEGRRPLQPRPVRVRLDLRASCRLDVAKRLLGEGQASTSSSCASTTSARRRRIARVDPRTSRARTTSTQDWAEHEPVALLGALAREDGRSRSPSASSSWSAALNIVASLILLVMEKHRDIAILKTMGASARERDGDLHDAGADHRRRRHDGRRGRRVRRCRTCSIATS